MAAGKLPAQRHCNSLKSLSPCDALSPPERIVHDLNIRCAMYSHADWNLVACCDSIQVTVVEIGCSAQAHWSATVHLALLAVTSSFVLSLLPFLYFALHQYWHWYQSSKAPTGTTAEKGAAASSDNSSATHQDGQSLS